MSSKFGFTTPEDTLRPRAPAEQAGVLHQADEDAEAENAVQRRAVEAVIRSKLAVGHAKVEAILQDYKHATRSDALIEVFYLGEQKPPDIQVVFDKPGPELAKLEAVLRVQTGLHVSVRILRVREPTVWRDDNDIPLADD